VGCIINIASTAGVRPAPTVAAYGAAKAGLLSLTQSLAVEWAPEVRVNAIVPGAVLTEQTALHYPDEAASRQAQSSIPLGRFAEPKDVGDGCLFLASPSLAGYVTGASILLHGGGE
jgi:NAD(P)-dependent dehydrogenase (short-subunit alcohol dehydrogenase family)